MSYTHLAGRLIETQRSMLGESAIEIARSTEGITVTDDGTVEAIEGDERAVVGELVEQYKTLLGGAAEHRLLTATREFEDELVLPAALGGPETGTASDRSPRAGGRPAVDSASGRGPSEAVSDGGTVAVDPGPEPGPSGIGHTGDGVQSDSADPISIENPVTVEYTVASSITEPDPGADLDDVYLMPDSASGWQAPVTVSDAFVDAVEEATGIDEDALHAVEEYVDVERLLATLNGESGEMVSFGVEEFTVTFHRSGSLAVH